MPIICLEGASAVGKTTTSEGIAKITNAYIVPEVNLLFERPNDETKTWYLERQVERWQIVQNKLKKYDTVILDGDIFQPLAYNWCFNFEIFNQSLEFIYEFYLSEIMAGRIGFPDKYFYLSTSQANLRQRKEHDLTRKRRNFEEHLEIIVPHRRYYGALNERIPNYVKFMNTKSLRENIQMIINHLPSSSTNMNSKMLLNNIKSWLTNNQASHFIYRGADNES